MDNGELEGIIKKIARGPLSHWLDKLIGKESKRKPRRNHLIPESSKKIANSHKFANSRDVGRTLDYIGKPDNGAFCVIERCDLQTQAA